MLYDIRQLRKLVQVLASRMCRSSVELTAALGGPNDCRETIQIYLVAQVGEVWTEENADETAQAGSHVLGMDEAYFPFGAAAYEACEVDARGQRVPYASRLKCLNGVLDPLSAAEPERARRVHAVRSYLAELCRLERATALGAYTSVSTSVPDESECSTQFNVRALFFLSRWDAGEKEGLKSHVAAHRSWGRHIQTRLPKLSERFRRAAQDPAKDEPPFGPLSPELYVKAVESIAEVQQAAAKLAQQECSEPTPPLDASGECEKSLVEYWLSYAHIAGVQLEGDDQ